jgi:hypothetical protein
VLAWVLSLRGIQGQNAAVVWIEGNAWIREIIFDLMIKAAIDVKVREEGIPMKACISWNRVY